MPLAIGETVSAGTAGSVLFVDSAVKLAEDNNDFFYDAAGNTLKSKDQASSASSNFSISTGDITGTTGAASGAVTIDTGNGSTAVSSGTGGVSGNVTVTTGSGGGASGGAAGKSGDLLLKTGSGGASSSGAAGNSGSIIIQPGSLGSGIGGTSGSTLVRAPTTATSDILAVQSADGVTNHWAVASGGQLNGTNALQFTHTTTNASINTLFVNGAGAKTGSFTAMNTGSTATSSTASITKTALSVQSTGTWNGTNAINRALYVNATGGTKNFAAIFEAGTVGVGVTDPTALLHLASGTASLPAFKLNAGTKLTSAQAGAVEWDGAQIWITQSGGTRRSLIAPVANVMDFGAVGNGTTDDAQAVKDAVATLVATGGVVYFPPHFKYKIDSSVTIQSYFPIFIVSQMGRSAELGSNWTAAKLNGYITPGDTISGGLFHWVKPATIPAGDDLDNGGGGLIGVVITDKDFRTQTVDAAVYVQDGSTFWMDKCLIMGIKGRAVLIGNATWFRITGCNFNNNGNSGSPAQPTIDVGDGTTPSTLFIYHTGLEGNYLAPYVKTNGPAGVFITDCWFERGAVTDTDQKFVVGSAVVRQCVLNGNNTQKLELTGDNNVVESCSVAGGPSTNVPTVTFTGHECRFVGNLVHASSAQTGKCLEMSGAYSMVANCRFQVSGNILLSGVHSSIVNVEVQDTFTQQAQQSAVIKVTGDDTRIIGNHVLTCNQSGVKGIEVTANGSIIVGNIVSGLTNANGIDTSAVSLAILTGNMVYGVGTGQEYSLLAGTPFGTNYPSKQVSTELTITSGVITKSAVKVDHRVDTESDAATDDLNTINGGSEGDVLYLRAENDARSIVFKHGTGNIQCNGNADITLDSTNDLAMCFYNGTKWLINLVNAGT